ncbi:MAG: hypothetical protein WBV41_05890 [Terriglobales bacterium]
MISSRCNFRMATIALERRASSRVPMCPLDGRGRPSLHQSSLHQSKTTVTMALTMAMAMAMIIFLVACLVACGDPKYQPPAIVVTFSTEFPPPSALDLSATAPIAAIVTNGPPNDGLAKFSCLPAGQCGTFSPNPIASNVPTAYTAPPTLPPNGSVTVTATSVSDPTKSISATITINAP